MATEVNPQPGADLKPIEFQAVLDLTIAINQNKPELGLFAILENYLLEKLGISHFSLFYKNETWQNGYTYGKSVNQLHQIADLGNQLQVSTLAEAHGDLAAHNDHIRYVIPFFYDRQLKGLVFCSPVSLFSFPFDAEAIALIQTLLGLMVMALENQRLLLYRLQQEALRKEIEIARQVQQMLFPKELPDTAHLKIYRTYLPHMDVSGDYYDYIELGPHQFALCVADVSGKGISAALLMSNFQACIRTLMMQRKPLEDLVHAVNSLLCQNSNLERFITAFIGIIDLETRTFTYVNAGHTPPCLVYNDGRCLTLNSGTTILGVFPKLPHFNIGTAPLEGNVLFAGYTDGLSEIESPENEEFGSERLEQYFVENRSEKPAILHQRLLNRLEFFAANQGFKDDITLITAEITA